MHAHSAALGDARALFAPPGAPPLRFTPASLSATPPLSPPAGGGWGATLRRAGVFRADRGAASPASADDAAVRRRIRFASPAPAVHSSPPADRTDGACSLAQYNRLAASVRVRRGGEYPSEQCAERVTALLAAAAAARANATRPADRRASACAPCRSRALTCWLGRRSGDGAPPPRVWRRLPADAAKREAVVDAMRHAWGAYEQARAPPRPQRRCCASKRLRAPLRTLQTPLLFLSPPATLAAGMGPRRAGPAGPPRQRRAAVRACSRPAPGR